MASYLSPCKYAKLLGITRQAVYLAAKGGRVILTDRGIDPEHIVNLQFAANAKLRSKEVKGGTIYNERKKEQKEAAKRKVEEQKEKARKEKEKKSKKKQEQEEEPPTLDELYDKYKKIKSKVGPGHGWEQDHRTELPQSDAPTSLGFIDPLRKLYEETRLKKITADTKSLEYGQKMKILIDQNSLNEKFGAFYDYLINQLIYMPEEASDMLWNRAKSAKAPAKMLEEDLKDRIRDIISKAKKAARKIIPDENIGKKYVLLDFMSEEGDEYEEVEKQASL